MKKQIEKLWNAYNNEKMEPETIAEEIMKLWTTLTAEEKASLEHLFGCCQDSMND